MDDLLAGFTAQRESGRAREAAKAARTAPRTIARYLTVGGAVVDITAAFTDCGGFLEVLLTAACGGCPATAEPATYLAVTRDDQEDTTHTGATRDWAQTHAETCRAMPPEDAPAPARTTAAP